MHRDTPSGQAGPVYRDRRPTASLRLPAVDEGIVLRFGAGPGGCDALGAREASVVADGGRFVLFYDGAAEDGWRACGATSTDLRSWERHGPVLDLGAEGRDDSVAACSPWVVHDGERWHMFYVGSRNLWVGSLQPGWPTERVPSLPYLTLKAVADDLLGPWRKDYACVPYRTRPGTFYATGASAGATLRAGDEYLQFFSGQAWEGDALLRTLGLARTADLDGAWSVDDEPLLAPTEQIENSSVYRDRETGTYYLFTNHIGIDDDGLEFTDAVWVYWSDDPTRWDPDRKAVVLDGDNCSWSSACIGMPTVTEADGRLALLYDAPGGASKSHVGRHIGLAWLDLPLRVPG
jgi:predicted GH43/DUF377 family glycosyl hydrolase